MLSGGIFLFTQGFDEIEVEIFAVILGWGLLVEWVCFLIIYDTWIKVEVGSVRNYPKLAILCTEMRIYLLAGENEE